MIPPKPFGIHAIRPKVLFQDIEQMFPGQNVPFKVNIPSPDIGGMTLLESSVLVCLAKLLGCSNFFEFGTYMGATTLLLAENSPAHARVVTLDIPPPTQTNTPSWEGDVLKNGDSNDAYLRTCFAHHGARCITRADGSTKSKVHQLLQDSTTLDIPAQGLAGQFDFILIDGGHHFNIVKSDTAKAYQMAKPNAVVVWHDYSSNIHADVTTFLSEHAKTRTLYHVQNTMLAFELLGNHPNMMRAL